MTKTAARACSWRGPGIVPPGAVPTTLVLDKQGRVASRVLGEIQKGTLKALIASAVAESGGPRP